MSREQDKLVLDYRPFVYKLAWKYVRGSTLCIDDVVQEGMLGLVKASKNFDPSRGYDFSTYARYRVKEYMVMYIQKEIQYSKTIKYLQDNYHVLEIMNE
jgi:RNA polymerase sigma factor (sigma-70 family)